MPVLTYTPGEQAFIDEALRTIEMNSMNRINTPAKQVLSRNNFVFDAHSHVFDGSCVDADYKLIRLLNFEDRPFARKLIQFIVRRVIREHEEEYKHLSAEQILEIIYKKKARSIHAFNNLDLVAFESDTGQDVNFKIKLSIDWIGLRRRIKEVLAILNNDQMRFVYDYFTDHAIHHHFNGKELISIQLGMDLESGWKGSIIKKFKTQTQELLTLSAQVPILPYLPLHPERASNISGYKYNELYDTFIDSFKAGGPTYFGVKCYPALGYLPADKVLAPIFHVCEQANIPVATHCGGEIVSSFEDRIVANEFGREVIIEEGSRKNNAKRLNEPSNWIPVLNRFRNLRLNIGHFGGDSAWELSADAPHHRITTILQLMKEHPNVYADFSFNFNNKRSSAVFANHLKSANPIYDIMKTRSMFGTDFWVVVPQSNLKKDQKYFKKLTKGHHQQLFIDNVLNYLGINE